MQELTLRPRAYAYYGRSDLESVWSNETIVTRAGNTWRFPFSVALCRICGFCFNFSDSVRGHLLKYRGGGLLYFMIDTGFSDETFR